MFNFLVDCSALGKWNNRTAKIYLMHEIVRLNHFPPSSSEKRLAISESMKSFVAWF